MAYNNQQTEEMAKATCGTLGRFFALFCHDTEEQDVAKRIKRGNNRASYFRKGKGGLSKVELDKLEQLYSDMQALAKPKRNNTEQEN